MRAIVQRFACAPNPEPVPVIRLHIIFVRHARRRPLPQIPIELRRHRHFFPNTNRLAYVHIPGLCKVSPADRAAMNLVDNLNGVRRRPLLCAHLHQLSIFLLHRHEQRSFGRVMAARLFDIHVLTCLHARNGHRRMPMIGRRNRDRVHVLQLQDAAKVLLRRRSIAHFGLYRAGKLAQDVAVHIANMRDACLILVRLER